MLVRTILLSAVALLLAAPMPGFATHKLYEETQTGSTQVTTSFTDSWSGLHTPWPGDLLDGGDRARKYVVDTPVTVNVVPNSDTSGTVIRINAFPHVDNDSSGQPHHADRWTGCPQSRATGAAQDPAGTVASTDQHIVTIKGVQPGGLRLGPGVWVVYVDGVAAVPDASIDLTINRADPSSGDTFRVTPFSEGVRVVAFIDGVPVGTNFQKCPPLGVADPFGPSSDLGADLSNLLTTEIPLE